MVRPLREECGWKVGTRCGKKRAPLKLSQAPLKLILSTEVSGPNEGSVDL